MPCWVAPVVAAEFWKISVEQVYQRIREGSVPTKVELGFTVVDVAPHVPERSIRKTVKSPPPATFTLIETPETVEPAAAVEPAMIDEADEQDDITIQLGEDSTSDETSFDDDSPPGWLSIRRRVAEQRRRPCAAAA